MQPGIYYDLSDDEYHRGPGVSSSQLKHIALRTPAHFHAAAGFEPEDQQLAANDALSFGRAYHAAVLQPELFEQSYAKPLPPEALEGALRTVGELRALAREQGVDLKGLTKKVEVIERLQDKLPDVLIADVIEQRHQDENAGRKILPAGDHERIVKMRERLLAGNTMGKILAPPGDAEMSIYWTDAETGVLLKIRPDWVKTLSDHSHFLVDLKTTVDASPHEFARSIDRFGYHISAAMYCEGFQAATSEDISGRFLLAAQEKNGSYEAATYLIQDQSLAEGHRLFRKALRLYTACKEIERWPGYPDRIQNIDIPKWSYNRPEIESEHDLLGRILEGEPA